MKKFSLVVLIILFTNIVFGGSATEYILEFWLPYILDKPVDATLFPHCVVAGLFLGVNSAACYTNLGFIHRHMSWGEIRAT